MQHDPFTIRIIPLRDDRYESHVECAAGTAEASCDLSALDFWLEIAAEAIPIGDEKWRSGDLDTAQQTLDAARAANSQWSAQKIGSDLFRAVFKGEISRLFYESLGQARAGGGVLPVAFRFELEDPLQARLATLPWEQLYDPERGHFLAQKEETPVVRYLSFEGRVNRLELPSVLRVLVVTASPVDLLKLDFPQEKALLSRWPQANIVVRRLDRPTRSTLRRALRGVHVLHFMGHGTFDLQRGEGAIGLLDTNERGDWVSGPELASWLLNRPELRLVVLNACSTGADMSPQPFTGVASALVRGGVPAVLAMRRPVPDEGAVKLARELYSRLMEGRPLDAALSSARHELAAEKPKTDHWATPALFVHTTDVFHVPADVRPSLAKIYSWLGVITANLAINAWSRSQQGPTLPGFGFSDIDQETVPIFGVLLVAPPLILLLYVLLRYQRATKDAGIFHRLPVAFGVPLMESRWLARVYQWIILLALVVMPVASQVHFMRLIYEGTTWECKPDHHDFATRLEHLTKPAPLSVLWDHEYCFGPKKKDGVRNTGCDDVAVCEVTFFPFWQPWLYLLGELVVSALFISVMWGIWAREPLRWRTLLMKRKFWAIGLTVVAGTGIVGQLISEDSGLCSYFVELDGDRDLHATAHIRQIDSAWRDNTFRARLRIEAKAAARLHWHGRCGPFGGGIGDRVNISPSADENLELALSFNSGTVVPRYQLTLAAPRQIRLKDRIEIPSIADVPIELPVSLPESLLDGELPTIHQQGTTDVGPGMRRAYELTLKPSRVMTGPKGIEIHFDFARNLTEVKP